MDYTNDWVLKARRIGQTIGILRPMQRAYRKLARTDYEQAFDAALKASIRPGDTVWDVGANVGYYAPQFAEWVGSDGKVIAVEPSPSSLPDLRAAVEGIANVVIEEIALSNETGEAEFFLSTEGASPNEGLSKVGSATAMVGHKVKVLRGEELADRHAPNVVKVDVEGFELEVIEGMGVALNAPELRTIAIEVHFQTINRRGIADAPKRLTKLLKEAGFSLRWTDPSHLVASR